MLSTREGLGEHLEVTSDSQNATGSSPFSQNAKARLQGDLLTSDMSSFKAANPGAGLEDFVRWHSPRDWLPDPGQALGGHLSPRIVSASPLLLVRPQMNAVATPCNSNHKPYPNDSPPQIHGCYVWR